VVNPAVQKSTAFLIRPGRKTQQLLVYKLLQVVYQRRTHEWTHCYRLRKWKTCSDTNGLCLQICKHRLYGKTVVLR